MMQRIHPAMMAVVCATLLSLGAAVSAAAQVCGDADGNGSVTVTDGVQVLRGAAGLSSSCSDHANDCDVDGSGSTTVTDGVNVLRKAASLPITENCPGGSAGAGDAQAVADDVVPFLTLALTQVPNVTIGSATASVQPAGGTENCEDGGTRTVEQSLTRIEVTFAACKVSPEGIGRFQIDRQIVVNLGLSGANVQFELNVTDLDANRLIDFDGTIQGTPRAGGGFIVNGGPINVSSSEGGQVRFTVTFNNLTVDGDGKLVGGSAHAQDSSNNTFPDLDSADFVVQSSTAATVHVVHDDRTTDDFNLNLTTGELTPQ